MSCTIVLMIGEISDDAFHYFVLELYSNQWQIYMYGNLDMTFVTDRAWLHRLSLNMGHNFCVRLYMSGSRYTGRI